MLLGNRHIPFGLRGGPVVQDGCLWRRVFGPSKVSLSRMEIETESGLAYEEMGRRYAAAT